MNEKVFRLKTFEKASYCRYFEEEVIKNLKEKKYKFQLMSQLDKNLLQASMATICEDLKIKPLDIWSA